MSEWRIRHSAATSTPSGRGFLVYIESPSSSLESSPNNNNNSGDTNSNINITNNSNKRIRSRCTCLTEVGNTPVAAVEHLDVASVVLCDFVDEERRVTTWMCVVHGEEHFDSIGRTAIGKGASILTSYPIGRGGDASPRICPLLGISARSARQGVTGCYVFGTAPSSWKVPLAARAQSVTGQWVGQPIIPTTATSMTFDLLAGGSASDPNVLLHQHQPGVVMGNNHNTEMDSSPMMTSSNHHHHHHTAAASVATHHQQQQNSLQVSAWCLLTPYTIVPIFLCGTPPLSAYSADGDQVGPLEGSVLSEFTISGGVTIVVFMSTRNIINLFAVECAAGGDALIWHVIPGECQHFASDHHILNGQQQQQQNSNIINNNNTSSTASLVCDEVECQAIPSKDPMRCILALRFPRSESVVLLETPPLRTESAFFPLDQPLSHHQPQHSSNNNNTNQHHQDPSHHHQQIISSTTSQQRHHVDPLSSFPSSRSASQATTHASSSLISNAGTSHHPSCSPQRCEFLVLERFSSTSSRSYSLFKWCPVGAGASLSAFAGSSNYFSPFFGVVEHVRGNTTSKNNNVNTSPSSSDSSSTKTTSIMIYARGNSPGRVDKISTLLSSSSSSDCSHITQACPLLGSYLLCRDRQTTSWYLDQRLPNIRPCSIEFYTLTTIMSVLPQHADDLYRFLVQELLSTSSSSSQQNDEDVFFSTLQKFLLVTTRKGQQGEESSNNRNKSPSNGLTLFSPWDMNKNLKGFSPLRINNHGASSSATSSSTSSTIDNISRQVATFALHILSESLKVDRVYCFRDKKLNLLSQLILALSESCNLKFYMKYYRESLMILSADAEQDDNNHQEAKKENENTNNYNQGASSSSSASTTTAFTSSSTTNNNNNNSSSNNDTNTNTTTKLLSSKRGSKLEAAAAAKLNSSSSSEKEEFQLFYITVCQFFDGIPNINSNNRTFDPRVPLDILSSLRWMSEGLEPLVGEWPKLKTYNISPSAGDHHHSSNNMMNDEEDGQDGSSVFAMILQKRDPYRHANDIFNFSLEVYHSSMFSLSSSKSTDPTSVIELAVDLGWNSNFLETRLPPGVARPIYQAIALCRDRLSPADQMLWRPEAVDLIGRHDILLAALNNNNSNNNNNNSNMPSSLLSGGLHQQQKRRRQQQRLLSRAVPAERKTQREAILFSESFSRHIEACASTGSSLAQIIETEAPAGPFSQVKTEKIHSLLSATSPIPLPATVDHAEAVQTTLPLLVRRAVAVAVGRGMLNLATHNFRERDRVPVPPLVLSGLTADGLVIHCEARMVSAETMKWPSFHNACSAALRFLPLPPPKRTKDGSSSSSSTSSPIARHWIVHQARDTQHRAGVLLAVGLLGHLSQLQLTDIYSIFVAPSAQDPQREPLTIAMLLGLGSSFRRTRSEAVFRCLAVHIQSLTPNGEDVEVSLDVQSAALIALGLVFEGAGQSFLVDMLLNDISRPPSDQVSRQREGYSLASGIALGLMLLGHGRNHNLAHLGIEERLLSFLEGGKREHARPHLFRPDSVYSDVTESVSYPNGDEKFLTRALVSQARIDVSDPCNTVSEGKTFNVQITGPAATIALGLMFMKTRDEWIARHLDLPSTLPLLDAVTPQLSLLRVLCAGLIRWRTDPDPPTDIVESYLPDCLQKYMVLLKTNVSLRELDTQAQYRSLHLGYAHAGAALAVGMTFAGTLVASVKSMLLAAFEGFANGNIGSSGIPQPMIHKKSHSFDQCLASTAIAVALVSAGTGDNDVLQALTAVLKKGNFTYGTYMAISSAIGLLFLGGGRCTLSNSVQSVAALLLAFYPQWPQTAGDNTNHLQALRHFYTLSVVPRWLSTFDVESGRVVTTSARLVMNSNNASKDLEVSLARPDRDVSELAKTWTPVPPQKQQQQSRIPNNNNYNSNNKKSTATTAAPPPSLAVVTPCLLPEINNIDRIEIREPGYYNLTVWNGNNNNNNNSNNNNRSSSIGIKKKPRLFFGSKSIVFGEYSWDAAIRDALIVYNNRNTMLSSSSSSSNNVLIQDLALLFASSASLSMMNINTSNSLMNTAASGGLPSTIHLVERLGETFNRFFTKPLLGKLVCMMNGNNNSRRSSDDIYQLLRYCQQNAQCDGKSERRWMNQAIHYSGLNVWWGERLKAFDNIRKISSAANTNDNNSNSQDDDDATTKKLRKSSQEIGEELLQNAGVGKFGVEVVMSLV